jgi:5-methylcytosine-specific restriction enzyme A
VRAVLRSKRAARRESTAGLSRRSRNGEGGSKSRCSQDAGKRGLQADCRRDILKHKLMRLVKLSTKEFRDEDAAHADFHADCVKAIETKLQLTLKNIHRSLYVSSDGTTAIVCAVSKDYQKPSFRYWYSFHPYQADFLAEHKRGFLVLGAGSPELIFVIPFQVFEPWSKKLNTTKRDDGNYYYHIRISCEASSFYLQLQGRGEKVEITAFRLNRDEPRGNMSRKQFVLSKGATCKNWGWSWSFVNESEQLVIFGLWDYHTNGLILSEDWRKSASGWKNRGYDQALEHIRLIEEEGYRLMTFPMQDADAKRQDDGNGRAKIGGFIPVLTEKKLKRVGRSWYAKDVTEVDVPASPDNDTPDEFPERKDSVLRLLIRDTKISLQIKRLYEYRCQICRKRLKIRPCVFYAEAHHLQPLGGEHKGPDVKDNILCLCPNHHVLFDNFAISLDPAKLRLRKHDLRQSFVDYHNRRTVGRDS